MVFVTEMIISDTRTTVSLMETLISVMEKMASETEIIISATDTAFTVSEKTIGGAPAVGFRQQPRQEATKFYLFGIENHESL
jgi:hypothetical protein